VMQRMQWRHNGDATVMQGVVMICLYRTMHTSYSMPS
jgi:hypothetical protein